MSSGQTPTPTEFMSGRAQTEDIDFPEVPSNIWSKVQSAPNFTGEFNEQNLFRLQYFEAFAGYYAQATDVNAQGRAILNLFMRWYDVSSEFAQFVLSGDADNPLDATLSYDPEGAGEAFVRPIQTDTFAGTDHGFGANYTHTPTGTGQFNLIPDSANGAGNGDTVTATGNEQAWVIFGWIDPLTGNVVPYDYLQADVNDNVGVRRREFLLWQMEGEQTLQVADRLRGPLLVEPGFDLDVDINVVTANIETGLWPLGIEIIRADAEEFAGVLG